MLNLTSAGNQGFVDVAPQMVIAVTRQQGEWFTEIVLKDGNVVHVVEDVDEVKKLPAKLWVSIPGCERERTVPRRNQNP